LAGTRFKRRMIFPIWDQIAPFEYQNCVNFERYRRIKPFKCCGLSIAIGRNLVISA